MYAQPRVSGHRWCRRCEPPVTVAVDELAGGLSSHCPRCGTAPSGAARLDPADGNVPEIGDELAVARALANLSHKLLDATVADIEAVTHEAAHLTR